MGNFGRPEHCTQGWCSRQEAYHTVRQGREKVCGRQGKAAGGFGQCHRADALSTYPPVVSTTTNKKTVFF